MIPKRVIRSPLLLANPVRRWKDKRLFLLVWHLHFFLMKTHRGAQIDLKNLKEVGGRAGLASVEEDGVIHNDSKVSEPVEESHIS